MDEKQISSQDKKELQIYLRSVVSKELRAGGYQVEHDIGPYIFGIRFTLSDMNSGNPWAEGFRKRVDEKHSDSYMR